MAHIRDVLRIAVKHGGPLVHDGNGGGRKGHGLGGLPPWVEHGSVIVFLEPDELAAQEDRMPSIHVHEPGKG